MSDVIGTAKIVAELDSSGVEVGAAKGKRALADLGASAAKSGKQASDGIAGLGKGSDQAAQKVDSATKNMIGSIQRQIAAMEAGSKSGSEYYKVLAGQRGIDTTALKPYLDQLDAAANKQGKAGVSAAQMANNLRMVGPQVTDIVTSLQAGQKPLTVFIQQGGQLKDVFGGIGPAARALGGYVVGLINPFTLAAAGAAALALAYSQGSKEGDAYAKALILSGNAAGETAGHLQEMARRIDGVTDTQADAAAAIAQFAANGNIASDSIERFSLIAVKMERDAGQAVKETVKQFAELGKSPVEASVKLNETTNYLTASIYQQIKALEDQGKMADAGALAQKAYADALDTRLKQIGDRLGLVERGWRGIIGAAKDAWDSMLNVGREQTAADKLSSIGAQIVAVRKQIATSGEGGRASIGSTTTFGQDLKALIEQQSYLQENARLEVRSAEAQKASAEQAKARIAFDKDGEKFLTERVKMEQEITKARNEGAAAGASQAEIEKRVANIRASHKGITSTALQIDKAKLSLDIDAIQKANDQLVGSYSNAEKIMESLHSAGITSDKDYYESKREFIRLESDAQQTALQKEIVRYQQEKLTGKDKLENDKKIADTQVKLATVRADASAKLEILSNQEAASAKRLQLSYLTARQAAQDYFDTIQRQQQRSLAGIGQGAQQRNFDSGINQIEDRYAGQRRDLENQKAQLELEGKFTDEAKTQYDQRLSIINDFQAKSIASYTGYYAELMKKQGDWALGAQEGLKNYLDDSRNVFKQTEGLVTDAFGGMEDALVNFIKTGKLSFGDLANTIVADLARMQVKALETKLFDAAGGANGIGSFLGMFSGDSMAGYSGEFSNLALDVGNVSAKGNVFASGQIQKFSKGGTFTNSVVDQPTLAPTSLFGEAGPEAIMPLMRGSDGSLGVKTQGGQSPHITYAPVINVDSRADRVKMRQDVDRQIQAGHAQFLDQLRRARVI
jgi:lambda family phage tail tape measure protein